MQCVRIWFKKNGRAKYISHLDLMRSMTRAVKRAGIPLWYTEGFNPHPYITFPLPLSLGVESDRECMDIKIEDGVSLEEIKNSFENKMPEGLEVFEVSVPFNDAKEIRYATYEIKLKFVSDSQAKNYLEKSLQAIEDKSLIGHKKGKKGKRKVIKDIPLAEHIFEFESSLDGDMLKIDVKLSSGNENNINPSVFLNSLNENAEIEPEYFLFYKTGLYTANSEIFR
ncbi:MAG: DUF2344 domain-containing protein [Clostridia bacterium]|nr:DUF2344 domain-containing protein [Clostridia bacterium]